MGRLWNALFYSLAGMRDAWRHPACRLEILAIVIAVPAALALTNSVTERLLLIGSVVGVLVVELLNTSIESTIDRIGVERHELSRVAKDMGSAAVLIAAMMTAAIWIALAGPPLLALWRA